MHDVCHLSDSSDPTSNLLDQDTKAIQLFLRRILQQLEDAKDFNEPSVKVMIPRSLIHLGPYNKKFVERAVILQLIAMEFELSERGDSGEFEVSWKKAATTQHCCRIS
jgi:hypothetical protein